MKTINRLLASLLALFMLFAVTPTAVQTAYAADEEAYTVILSPGGGTGEAVTYSIMSDDATIPRDSNEPGTFYRTQGGKCYFILPAVPSSFLPEGANLSEATWSGHNPGDAIEVDILFPVTLTASIRGGGGISIGDLFSLTLDQNYEGGSVTVYPNATSGTLPELSSRSADVSKIPEDVRNAYDFSFAFKGWAKSPKGKPIYAAGTSISKQSHPELFTDGDPTLYAIWEPKNVYVDIVVNKNNGDTYVWIPSAPFQKKFRGLLKHNIFIRNDVRGFALSSGGPIVFQRVGENDGSFMPTDVYMKLWAVSDFTVNYQVEGGRFPVGASSSETVAIEETKDGWEVYGFLKNVPTGMTPDDDHANTGAWYREGSATPVTDMTAEKIYQNTTFTYKFDPAPAVDPGPVVDPGQQQDKVYAVGEDTFATLEAAIAGAGNGATIRVLQDHTESASVSAASGKSFVLDLNGKTLTMAGLAPAGRLDITILGTGGGTLKLTGTGEFSGIAPKTSKKVNLTVKGGSIRSDGLLLYSTGSGSGVTVSGGTITCAGATKSNGYGQGAISGSGISAVSFSGGSFTVSKGMVIRAKNAAVTISAGSFLSTGLEIVREAKSLAITGGTFSGNGTVSSTSDGTTEIHGVGVESITVTGGTFKTNRTGKGKIAYLKENDPYMWEDAANGMYQVVPAAARVDDLPATGEYTKYGTFRAAAAAAVQNGKVVTLLKTPASGDAYTLAQGETLKVIAKGFTVPVLPEDGVTVTVEGDVSTYQLKTQYTVTYEVEGGHFPPGAAASEKVYENGKPASVPVGMMPNTGFKDTGAWYKGTTKLAGSPANEAITQDTVFTYKFDAKTQYTVTYEVEGGNFPPGATTSEKVYENGKPASVPVGMMPNTGFKDTGAWYKGTTKLAGSPANETIAQDTVFTYKFDAKTQYTVTYEVEGGHFLVGMPTEEKVYENGKPASVPVGMMPNTGFKDTGAWYKGTTKLAGSPANETIAQDTVFTYKFDAKTQYTVTYEVEGGNFPPGATTSEKVYENDKPASVPVGMMPNTGFKDTGAWYKGTTKLAGSPANEAITQDTVFTYKFDAKTQYTVTYEVEGGGSVTWTKGSNRAVTLTVKRSEEDNTCLAHFTGVEIDGTALVKDTDYTAVSGSTVITLKASALQKLSVGSHTVTAKFDDGKAMATITVKAASGGEIPPRTGDESNLAWWLSLMIVSMVGMAAAVCARKKMRLRRHGR